MSQSPQALDWDLTFDTRSPSRPSTPVMKYESSESMPGYPTPISQSASRVPFNMARNEMTFSISRNTMVCGYADTAVIAVDCVSIISETDPADRPNARVVFEVIYGGRRAVAKCWAPSRYNEYIIETSIYEKIAEYEGKHRPDCFATCYFSGQILCSSVFPEGYVMIFEKRPGAIASSVVFDHALEELNAVVVQLRKGISFMSYCGVTIACASPLQHILVDKKHDLASDEVVIKITMVDFVSLTEAGGMEVPIYLQ